MTNADFQWSHSSEPLSPRIHPQDRPEGFEGIESYRFEYTSRGDRVPGRLLLPEQRSGSIPVVLFQHGVGGSKEADYLNQTVPHWVQQGAAIASIDFPLHGERVESKMTAQLLELLDHPHQATRLKTSPLWEEFVRQSVCDLKRCVDYLVSRPEIDSQRIGYAAFSLGSILGACFLGIDTRPSVAALAIGGGGFGPAHLDPAQHIGNFSPRPLLLINGTQDQRIPRESAEALHEGAREPKTIQWFDRGHGDLQGEPIITMWRFIRGQLGL